MDGGVPLLVLVLVLVVVFFGVSALPGLGGEGSGVCRSFGVEDGGPGRRCVGGKMGEAGELVLWPCSFIISRFRRLAADGSCGRLQRVVASSPRWLEVRRRRRQLGFWGERRWIRLFFSQDAQGALCKLQVFL